MEFTTSSSVSPLLTHALELPADLVEGAQRAHPLGRLLPLA